MLSQIIMHIPVSVMQVRNLTVLLLQQSFVVLNLFLQTSNVTLEFSNICLVATLFDGSVSRELIQCQRDGLTRCSE